MVVKETSPIGDYAAHWRSWERREDKRFQLPFSSAFPTLDVGALVSHTDGMTSTAKIAISLPKAVAEGARRAVRLGRAPSVSAYVADALEKNILLDDLSLLLDEMLETSGGPMTAAERRAADRLLRSNPHKSKKKRAK